MSGRLVSPASAAVLRMALEESREPWRAEAMTQSAWVERAMVCPAWTAAWIDGGTVVAAGCLILHWPGRAEACAVVNRRATTRQVVQATRAARRWIEARQRAPALRRVEVFMPHRSPWRVTFMRALGFRREARLRRWGPDGADYDLYAKVA
jgi:hypothetical protein